MVVDLDRDVELDAAPGQQRVHRRAQAVAKNERGAAQLLAGDDALRPHAGLCHQDHFLLRQPGREDQPAARQLRQQRDIDAAVDDELLEPHHAGMHRLQLDPRIVLAHAQ